MSRFTVITYLLVISVYFGLTASCSRDSSGETISELQSILGEQIECLQVTKDEGFLCKSKDTKKNYYCPADKKIKCFFTNRFELKDIPLEKEKALEKPPLTQ